MQRSDMIGDIGWDVRVSIKEPYKQGRDEVCVEMQGGHVESHCLVHLKGLSRCFCGLSQWISNGCM